MATDMYFENLLQQNLFDFKSFLGLYINSDELCETFSLEINVKMKRLVNSLKYWNFKFKHLKHPNLAILTTFNPEPNSTTSYSDILRNLENIMPLENIQELFIPENKNYLGIYFKTADVCMKMKNELLKIDGAYVVLIDWYNELLEVTGRIHYIPPFISQKQVGLLLSKYLFNIKLDKINYKNYKGFCFGSSVTAFKGILKSGFDLQSLPHFAFLDSNEVLITVKGRKPICTKCRTLGHVRKECGYIYCADCHLTVTKEHDCEKHTVDITYANIVKSKPQMVNKPNFVEEIDFPDSHCAPKMITGHDENIHEVGQNSCNIESAHSSRSSDIHIISKDIKVSATEVSDKSKNTVSNLNLDPSKVVVSTDAVFNKSLDSTHNVRPNMNINANMSIKDSNRSGLVSDKSIMLHDEPKGSLSTYSRLAPVNNDVYDLWSDGNTMDVFSPDCLSKDESDNEKMSICLDSEDSVDHSENNWKLANKRKLNNDSDSQPSNSISQNKKVVKSESGLLPDSNLYDVLNKTDV